MRSRGRTLLIGAFIMMGLVMGDLLAAALPGDTRSAGAAIKTRQGVVGILSFYLPQFAARELGYFQEEGIEAEIPLFDVTRTATQALGAGGLEFGWITPEFVILGARRGSPIVMVGGAISKPLYFLIAGPKYRTIADLRGTTLGVSNLRGGSTLLLQKMLGRHGLVHKKDYDMIEAGGTPKRFAAVKSGGVSASVVTIPTNFQAVDEGLVLLDQAPRYFAHYDFSVIAMNTNFARAHPQAVVGVLKGVIRATRWFYQDANRDRAVDLIQRVVKVSPRYAALTYDTLFRELKAVPPQAEVTEQGLEPVIEIMVELGQLPGKIPPLQYVDDSYRQQALKALAAR